MGISSFISRPNTPPSAITTRFRPMGFARVPMVTLPAPFMEESATEMATEYSTRPTTSSRATTCSRVSTKSPFAPVWRMVIMVEAGAVAEARAASTMEKASSSPSIQ